MGDENPIRTLGDYSKSSHEGYRNTIELPVGNNVAPLRSNTIRLVQNGCSFHGLWSEDPNQHLKDFLKLVDLLDLDGDNKERTRLYVSSTSDHRLIKLENQIQLLMEAHLAPTQPTQVNKVTTSCEIYSGPHDTQYCMEDPEQAFVKYVSSCTDEVGGKCQSNIEGLVFEFMESQAARLSKFEANFKRQQKPKLGTHPVFYARSYPTMDPQCLTQIHNLINAITVHPKQQSDSYDITKENEEEERGSPENHPDSPTPPNPLISFITEKVLKFNSLFESLRLVPPSPNAELVCTKEEEGDMMFIEIILKVENPYKEEPEPGV
ncbi:hypothetical protein Tco_0631362 [Tanacetum coccineum]